MNTGRIYEYLKLHILLFVYSLGGICSKLASGEEFLSLHFLALYGVVLCILFFYAIMWQQILKKMSLVTAYANKAVTIIWSLIWGVILFDEQVTIQRVIGIIVVMLGVFFVVTGEVEG